MSTRPMPLRPLPCRSTNLLAPALLLALIWSGCASGGFLPLRHSRLSDGGIPKVEKHQLANGLTVLLVENTAAPVVTIDMWVNTGAANEPRPINGISHFLEHMLFKGTANYPAGVVDRVLEGVGGVTNAGTSEDYTHYYVTIPSAHFTTGLDVLADMIMNAAIDPEEMERERLVILEEYRRKQDNPMAYLFEELYEKSFESGPYTQTVLGTVDTIKSISRDEMTDYYHRYYAPRNVAVIIAGDIEPQKALAEVRRAFAGFTREHSPFDADGKGDTAWRKGVEQIMPRDVNESYLGLSLSAPGSSDEDDVYAMKILTAVLGSGRSSRLERRIKEEQQLCVEIDAEFSRMRHPSLFIIGATFTWDDYAALKAAIISELRAAADDGITKAELDKAKRLITTGYYFSQETTSGQAGSLGYAYTITGTEKSALEFVEKIQAVTRDDVKRVAQKYIRPDDANWFVVKPKD